MKRWLLLLLALGLIAAARLWNAPQIFVDQQVYFVDADCYSRMTRVAAVVAHPGIILRHHDFENWPDGTTPHTTALFDYLIASVAWLTGKIDLAGAITPVLLAIASGIILWKWVGQFRFLTQIAVLLTFAISPILVHGTVLGRPDHQALLILLVIAAFATCSSASMTAAPSINPAVTDTPLQPRLPLIAILHGLAWGLALWTSLFEPAILLAANVLLGLLIYRKKWLTRSRIVSLITLVVILLLALAIEHWHTGPLPSGPLFERWAKSIGELAPVGYFSRTYLSWFSLAILALPIGLCLEKSKSAIHWGLLLLLTYALTAHAARWGYFMGISVLFVLPVILEKWHRWWIALPFFLGFWPVAREWDARLWPAAAEQDRLAEQHEDYRELRQICQAIDGGGVLAPWWLSPPIAYWSGANCVAGSSHQSLPGNEAVANFYLSRFPERARAILTRRQVRWVIAYEPSRVLSTASSLTDIPAANDALAATIYNTPARAPGFLQLEKETQFFRLYRVADGE